MLADKKPIKEEFPEQYSDLYKTRLNVLDSKQTLAGAITFSEIHIKIAEDQLKILTFFVTISGIIIPVISLLKEGVSIYLNLSLIFSFLLIDYILLQKIYNLLQYKQALLFCIDSLIQAKEKLNNIFNQIDAGLENIEKVYLYSEPSDKSKILSENAGWFQKKVSVIVNSLTEQVNEFSHDDALSEVEKAFSIIKKMASIDKLIFRIIITYGVIINVAGIGVAYNVHDIINFLISIFRLKEIFLEPIYNSLFFLFKIM